MSPPRLAPRPTRRRGLARGTWAGLLFASACGGPDAPPTTTLDLLARQPDERIERPGTLRPDPESQWGGLGHHGWKRKTYHLPDGRPFAVNGTIEARLALPDVGPAPRSLELEAWIDRRPEGDDAPPVAAEVRLNGEGLGTIELGSAPERHVLATPGELWRAGRNELVLRVPSNAYRSQAEGLALAEVVYGEARLVERDAAGALHLSPGTGLRHVVAPTPPARLSIAARGGGTLEVELRRLDPLTSRAEAVVASRRLAARDGAIEAELPVVAGREGPLALEVRHVAGEPVVLERLALADSPPLERPPIVLVSIDTLSARHLSLYGYPRRTTPNLERESARGTVFERCRANAPWTSPSYVSLFTGLYPTSVSMDLGEEGSRFLVELPRGRWTLTESLRALGYRTGGFVDVLHLDERFGFGQGFEHFDFTAGERPLEDPEGGFRHILPRALEWLDGLPPDEPFFLFVHVYDVHGPYVPEEAFAGRFRDDQHAAEGRSLFAGTLPHTFGSIPAYISAGAGGEGEPPPRLPAGPFVSAYDEEILGMDASLGELFDELRARGILEQALVVFTADHGESTDDHDYFGHGLLYEEVLRVPLVVWLPEDRRTRQTPSRVTRSVQLVDLYPTLLELVGSPVGSAHVHGRSFAPLLSGGELPPAPTYGEGGIMRQAAVELDGWKLIVSEPGVESLPWTMLSNPLLPDGWRRERVPGLADRPLTPSTFEEEVLAPRTDTELLAFLEELRAAMPAERIELYDLTADPGETRDLSAERPDKVAELLPHLRAARALREEARRHVEESLVPLTDEDLEELEKLGYVEGG